jgi:hypothetical protein
MIVLDERRPGPPRTGTAVELAIKTSRRTGVINKQIKNTSKNRVDGCSLENLRSELTGKKHLSSSTASSPLRPANATRLVGIGGAKGRSEPFLEEPTNTRTPAFG